VVVVGADLCGTSDGASCVVVGGWLESVVGGCHGWEQ